MPPPGACPSCTQVNQIRSDAAAMDDLDRVGQQTEARPNNTAEATQPAPSQSREGAAASAKMAEAPKDSFVRNENPVKETLTSRGEGNLRASESRASLPDISHSFLSSSALSSEPSARSNRSRSDSPVPRDSISTRSQNSSPPLSQNGNSSVSQRQENAALVQSYQKTNVSNTFTFASSQTFPQSVTNGQERGEGNAHLGVLTSSGSSRGNFFQAATHGVQGTNVRVASRTPFQQSLNDFAIRMFGFSSAPAGVFAFAVPTNQGRGMETRNMEQGNVKSLFPSQGVVTGLKGNFSLSSFSALKRIESHLMQFTRLLMGSYMFAKPGETVNPETYLEGALYLEDEIEERDELLEEEEKMTERVKHKRDAYFGSHAQHQKG